MKLDAFTFSNISTSICTWSGHTSASTFLISNFTAFANFLLSLVFFLYRISFCDSFGKIRYGSCYSSLYTLKGRLSVILFTSFIDLPLLFIVQLADRTLLLMQRGFSVCNIFTRLLLNLSPNVWFSAYKETGAKNAPVSLYETVISSSSFF